MSSLANQIKVFALEHKWNITTIVYNAPKENTNNIYYGIAEN